MNARKAAPRSAVLSPTLILAWAIMLAASLLPDLILFEVLDQDAPWLFGLKLALLALIVLAGFVVDVLRPVQKFALMFLVLLAGEALRGQIQASAFWQNLFGGPNAPFAQAMLSEQILRVLLAFIMIAILLFVLRYTAREAYVAPGDLRAPIGRTPLLGFKAGEISWARFGFFGALAIGSGTLVFLLASGASTAGFSQVIALLPAILLFATMNAFGEEVSYRSALLAPLGNVVSPHQAVMITAVFFGLAHFYGVPYGVVGVIMSIFLGWIMGKAMVETRGLFWAWFIHFVQDVLIFSFIVMGLQPGG